MDPELRERAQDDEAEGNGCVQARSSRGDPKDTVDLRSAVNHLETLKDDTADSVEEVMNNELEEEEQTAALDEVAAEAEMDVDDDILMPNLAAGGDAGSPRVGSGCGAVAGEGASAGGANGGGANNGFASIGSFLDMESPLNLRLATLFRCPGRAFRALAVAYPTGRRELSFEVEFTDVATGASLRCRVDEVPVRYAEWVRNFRASCIVLFVPTLASPNSALLENAVLYGCAETFLRWKTAAAGGAQSAPSPVTSPVRTETDPDHFLFSYSKLREVIGKKKKDETVNGKQLTVSVLNAYPEEWRQFITSAQSCAPQAVIEAAFKFSPREQALNKEMLHAQLSSAVLARLHVDKRPCRKQDQWTLVFVSAPMRSTTADGFIPPFQNLLTGEFIDPLKLTDGNNIYIIGSGTAPGAFARFPLVRKGKRVVSILLQDIESQLGMQKPHRMTLTTTLAHALDQFSRVTWMSLLGAETGELRVPLPPSHFAKLIRRTVSREILPSFLEPFFGAPVQVHSSGAYGGGGMSGSGPGRGGDGAEQLVPRAGRRRLEEHIRLIFNSEPRLERELALCEELRQSPCFFVDVKSANTTAARRADNPFSRRNGIVQFEGQLWTSMNMINAPRLIERSSSSSKDFVDPELCFPTDLVTSMTGQNGRGGIIIGWDVKRVLLFLRQSGSLRKFLHGGGRIWCAQYAQYLLKGFNHSNLGSIERTLLHYLEGPLKAPMSPTAKLRLIFEKQIEIAVNTRQLQSIVHRMDGLLAAAEMEHRGLQIVTQAEVLEFSESLKTSHSRLEKVLSDKVNAFTDSMDVEVRSKINFRSPQDISTIIYGGAMCRYLAHSYHPIPPAQSPFASIFPHAICQATGTPVPKGYSVQAGASSLASNMTNSGSKVNRRRTTNLPCSETQRLMDKLVHNATLDQVAANTAVVVLLGRVKPGFLLEQVSLYCPAYAAPLGGAAADSNAAEGGSPPPTAGHSGAPAKKTLVEDELNLRVAVDDILPVSPDSDIVTLSMLKEQIREFKPLRSLQPLKKYGKKSYDLRNVLILTNVTAYDRLESLVDSGVVRAIAETVLGDDYDAKEGGSGIERVCLCDVARCVPPPPQGAESFESDFSELGFVDAVGFTAKGMWETHTKNLLALGGYEVAIRGLMSHCAANIDSVRDPFRSTIPLPSSEVTGKHGQEAASTRGMLWIVTPRELYPLLHRTLRSRSVSSGADAMERVTSLLSPYSNIDLSFFSALQQLRFTEKKMQLFDEGALFRAVLPECNNRVHGELCHSVTATGRLSSQSPNLQNIPKEEDLRRLIVSRFGPKEGRMIEADYSQLEVVVLAALSNDPKMITEIKEKVDFHCLRVSLMTKEPYSDVIRKTKVDKNPEYIRLRQQAKTFSFQRQYGAGIATIATTTGLTEKEVEKLIAAEEHHYKDLSKFYRLVMDCVETGADRLLRIRSLDVAEWTAEIRRRILLTEPMHYFVVHTGSKFDFTRDKKSLPKLKNYPVQGLAGEIVQIMCGRLVRNFYKKNNYNGKAFLVNTVHDCVWIDAHIDAKDEVMKDVEEIMQGTSDTIRSLWPEMTLDVPFSVEIHEGPSLGELSR